MEKVSKLNVVTFLCKHNCYDKFLHNLYNYQTNQENHFLHKDISLNNVLEKYIKTYNNNKTYGSVYSFISSAFHWRQTPEGGTFWYNLNNIWEDSIDKRIANV